MEFTKFINLFRIVLCAIICISPLTVNSISLVSGPEDARAVIGTDVIFTCTVMNLRTYTTTLCWDKLSPDSYYRLTKGNLFYYNRITIVYSNVLGSYNLKIANVQPVDAGVYTCKYILQNGYSYNFSPRSAIATLTVLQPPSASSPICLLSQNMIPVPSETLFYVGESVKFHCLSRGHGNTSPNLHITLFDIVVTKKVIKEVYALKEITSEELIIESNNTEFKCYLESEALPETKVCGIKIMTLLPKVEIEPRSVSVIESTDVSFQCSGSIFKTTDLQYEWQISPDVPGYVSSFTSFILNITNLASNRNLFESKYFIVTCFVRDGNMVWNASSTLFILPNVIILPTLNDKFDNSSRPTIDDEGNKSTSKTSVTGTVLGILATVVVFVTLFVVFFYFREKIRRQIFSGENSKKGALDNEPPMYSVEQKENITKTNTNQRLNTDTSENAVYYSTITGGDNREPDSNYDNVGHKEDNYEPIYENKAFSPEVTGLNVEGLNYADLDLGKSTSCDMFHTEPTTTYATVTMNNKTN